MKDLFLVNVRRTILKVIALFLLGCNSNSKNDNQIQKTDGIVSLQSEVGKGTVAISIPMNGGEVSVKKENQFESVMKNVSTIDYVLKEYKEVNKSENLINSRIEFLNSIGSRKILPLLDVSQVDKVRRAFIKGTRDLGGRVYARADIESWVLSNEMAAKVLFEQVEEMRDSRLWEEISKSPITCFRKENEIIFITPGGFYMLDKVYIIENYLVEKL